MHLNVLVESQDISEPRLFETETIELKSVLKVK
jgi:hypothetical protein